MTLPFTSVVSLHTNPLTCGVGKFSRQLAQRIGVPFAGLYEPERWGGHPMWSLKWSEVVESMTPALEWPDTFSVFWHDAGQSWITRRATHVFYGDPSLGSPGLWCPSLITPRPRPVRLFSFGMASKLQTERYRTVQKLLADANQPYHLRVSVGLHEGTSLDGAEKHFDALKDIMGDQHVTILGILSDDAVSEELYAADYVLAFFEKGLRANNTTVHAALEHGVDVISNCEIDSLHPLALMVRNIDAIAEWPKPGFGKFHSFYSWDNLISEMKGVCDKSKSPAA